MIGLKKKTYLSILVVAMLLGTSVALRSQNTQIDSLKAIVETGRQDTAIVGALNGLSLESIQINSLDQASRYADQAILLADKLAFKKGKALALKNKGLVEYYQNNYKEVLNNWTQSLEIYESVNDTLGIAKLVNNLGAVYYSQGSHAKALDYYLRSLSLSEKAKDTFNIAQALVNIGGLYSQMEDYDKGLNRYQQIEKYLTGLDDPQIESAYLMGIGEVYALKGNHEEAIRYFQKALPINENTQDYPHTLTMLGIEEYKIGNKERAIAYLNRAYEYSSRFNITLDQVQTLMALGDLYQDSNISLALKSYKEAETLALDIETNEELRDIYKGMATTYQKAGNFKNAFEYQNKYLRLKDSIFNIKTDDKIRGLQFDFELEKKEDELLSSNQKLVISELQAKRQQYVIFGVILGLLLVLVLAVGSYKRYRYVKKTNKIIEEEKHRSEKLLLNILPEETAHELKENGKVAAKRFESVTILFSDFKGFTSHAQNLSPEILVTSIDYYFSKFDQIMDKYELEKIKTVGDAYMCAGGLPFPTSDHPFKMVEAAFEMAQVMEDMKTHPREGIVPFDVRIGINTGPVVAGVVGLNKFSYDIWGDSVNVASRMESMSEPGRINISENTYQIIKEVYECESRGKVEVKNKGEMAMYFVNGRKIIRHQKVRTEVNT